MRIVVVATWLVLVFGLVGPSSAAAHPGDLDSTFGTGGKVGTPLATFGGLAIDGDGRILAGGLLGEDGAPVVARYRSDGSPDATFGVGGIARMVADPPLGTVEAVATQADGRAIVAVDTTVVRVGLSFDAIRVLRLTADGAIDAGFDTARTAIVTGGDHRTPPRLGGLSIGADDTIDLAVFGCALGTVCPLVVEHLDRDGDVLSELEGNDADVEINAGAALPQPDGKIVSAASFLSAAGDLLVQRYEPSAGCA